jgi:hypothetical protein
MSRSRHMKRARGGRDYQNEFSRGTVYAGAGSNVLKEAEERKRGGKVDGEGEKGKHRADKRARGGKAERKEERKEHERKRGGKVEHEKERKAGGAVSPGRKRGGGIGANLTPLSTAARFKEAVKGEQSEDQGRD